MMTATYSPALWLGAPAPGGLTLPAAHPTPSNLYAPRGVFLNDQLMVVSDSGNHRIMIWHQLPVGDHAPADVVLGQPDAYSEGPKLFHLPTGVGVFEGRLFVADAWHHRVLFWNDVPEQPRPPDGVLGQLDLESVEVNRGAECSPVSLYWPYGLAYRDGFFSLADTGNRRVLLWKGLPEPDQPPELVLGQDDFVTNLENRGAAPGPHSFRWPHAITTCAGRYLVADAGNHRVLGWDETPSHDHPADFVLGQSDFESAGEWPYGPQGPSRLRSPYSLDCTQGQLAVSDTANNRILIWHQLQPDATFSEADEVLGQPDFQANGENRWDQVAADTLCWPYGLCLHGDRLAVADSGNNRVVVWRR